MSSSTLDRALVRRRPRAAAAAVVCLALIALVPIGRWEDRRNAAAQVAGMKRVAAKIGPLDSRSLTGYRRDPAFDCLVYRRGANRWALELCVNGAGAVVEAIDRTGGRKRYWTLRDEQSASTFRVDRREVDRLLRKMGAG
jgi:hypothetical protein